MIGYMNEYVLKICKINDGVDTPPPKPFYYNLYSKFGEIKNTYCATIPYQNN